MNRPLPKSTKDFFSTRLIAFCILLFVFGGTFAQTVTTPSVASVTTTTATLGGNVTAGPLTHRGTRWFTSSPVGTNNQLEEASAATGVFTQARTVLPAASKIFFTAYARDGATAPVVTSEASFFTEPTQLTGGQFTAAATSETAILLNFPSADSWEGSGTPVGGYVIFRSSAGAPSIGALADGAAPPADGVGDKITTITDGTFTSFNNTTGLVAETNYFYTIIPFVWDGTVAATYNYNTTAAQTVSDFTFSTNPAAHPADGSFTVTGVSPSQVNLAFDAPAGNTDGYIILRRDDASDPTTTGIQDGVNPAGLVGLLPAGTTLAGTSTTATFNDNVGLTSATRYRYLIIPYNANGTTDAGTYNYKTDGTPVTPKNDWTFANQPSAHATGTLTATAISPAQIDLSFNSVTTSGISNATGYIVLIKSSAIVVGDLATLNDGAAPNAFGLFEAIINSTATNTYSDMALTPNTTYHYAIIPYNRGADDETYNFLTTGGFITGSATTQNISATFTPIVAAPVGGLVLSAGTTNQVLTGFSVTSNGTQVISAMAFNYTGLTTQFTNEQVFRSTVAGALGVSILADGTPDGNFDFTALAAGDKTIDSTPVYYYLVVDVANSVTPATASVNVNPTQANITLAPGIVNAFSINRTFTFSTSQLSNIIINGGTTDNIDYISKRTGNPLTVANSISLATFRIQDGAGVNDPDNVGTTLTSVEIDLGINYGMIRRVALFDGGTLISGTQTDVTVPTVLFSGLSLATADGAAGTKDFTVRATFQNDVSDNDRIDVTITGASALNSGSGFADPEAGDATTTGIGGDANKIEVGPAALSLAFTGNPPNTPIITNFSLSVEARDAQGNVDEDYTRQVALTEDGPGALSVSGGQSLTPFLVAGVYNWTTLQANQSGTYNLLASDNPYDDDFADATGSVIITSSASGITPGTTTPATICYGNTVAGAIPTAYFPLSTITILETDPAGISGTAGAYTFSISLPTGFVFDQTVTSGVSSPLNAGTDITIPAAPHYSYPSSNTVQFSFTLNATATLNNLIISGLRVGHPHPGIATPPATGTLNITRSGGSATIAGVTPGTVLGTVGASQQNPAVTITVAPAVITDPPIDPNTTTFNVSGIPVKLVSSTPSGSVFTGPNGGVTTSGPDYRFNPNTLTAGNYPIVLAQTAGGGCQSYATTTFEVIVSGIVNLLPVYCDNDPASGTLDVNDAYIDQIMGEDGWSLDHFVYYESSIFNWLPITSPSTTQFDPKLTAYEDDYLYWGGEIPIGFALCNALAGYPCNGASNYIATYQWVTVRVAPTVNFTIAPNQCEDNAPVTLIGSPPNGTDIVDDNFTQTVGQGASITHTTVGPDEVWTFSPNLVTGVTSSTSVSFDITYKYTDPATNCSNTAVSPVSVHDRPSGVPIGNISKSVAGPPSNTTIQICAGTSVGTFTASDNTYSYRWYADPLPVSPANLLGALLTFAPPVDNLVPGTTPFYVTRERNGCESVNAPLALSVNVVAAPPAPTPDFTNGARQYCVGGPINPSHLGVPGTNLKWYNGLPPLTPPAISPIVDDNQPTIGELSVNTSAANVFSFSVTQTELVNGCEGPSTPITITVQALPVISITPIGNPIEICNTAPNNVKFTPTDQGNPAPGTNWTIVGSPLPGPGVLTNFNSPDGSVELNPLTGQPGTIFTLRYTYTNLAGCSNSGDRTVRIFPTVTPDIDVGPVCEGFPANFINNSLISAGGTVESITWNFNDGSGLTGLAADPVPVGTNGGNTSGTYYEPDHIFPNTGTFQVSATMVTTDGCSYSLPATVPVLVSPLPNANFISENVCVNSPTTFTGSADIAIQNYSWDFARANFLAPVTAVSAGSVVSFTYTGTGKDTVRLIATTAAGCQDIVDKPMYVVPNYSAITPTNSYSQGFAVNDGWIAGGVNSSWELGTPIVAPIIGDASPSGLGNAWDTNIGPPSDENNPNENSWVLSGCFNFAAGSVKPVISIDVWSDNPFGVDGAVLQVNTTGNIEDDIPNDPDPDGDWVVIGEVDSGINWYDVNGISNSPGNQTTISAGWTGNYGQWRTAIFKLDPLVGQSNVVFRIAFASSQPRGDGFAFDNIFIGERNRIVLLENFTNSSVTPPPTSHNFNNYQDFGNSAELVKIQYHSAFPGSDPINDLNKQMHNARTAFYGITTAPTVRLDGDSENGTILPWLEQLYDDRVLTPATIKLDTIAVAKVGDVVKINISVENTTSQALPVQGIHIFTTIVEKSITNTGLLGNSGNTEFVFVAKQMLPSAAGIPLEGVAVPTELGAGEIFSTEVTWENPNGDAIVIFVQSIEGNNKNVYQALFIDNPVLPAVITDTEDPAYAEKINLFPNPANHEVNIELPAVVSRNTPVLMFDTYGRTVYENSFAPGERAKKVNTSELAGGVYIIQIRTPEGQVARRKVMVTHR